jgi:multicomponent Na+:H+ antiporter subunit G
MSTLCLGLGLGLLVLGTALLVVAALGLFVLRDALSRQHAATKSATLALGLILLGLGFLVGELGWWLRIAALLAVLLATVPVAAHMLARAAAGRSYGTDVD